MPIPAQRTIKPEQVRNFGRIGDAIEVPPLTDVQTRSYDRFLQLDDADGETHSDRPGRRLAGNLSDRELRSRPLASITLSTSWASHATTRTSAVNCA